MHIWTTKLLEFDWFQLLLVKTAKLFILPYCHNKHNLPGDPARLLLLSTDKKVTKEKLSSCDKLEVEVIIA